MKDEINKRSEKIRPAEDKFGKKGDVRNPTKFRIPGDVKIIDSRGKSNDSIVKVDIRRVEITTANKHNRYAYFRSYYKKRSI